MRPALAIVSMILLTACTNNVDEPSATDSTAAEISNSAGNNPLVSESIPSNTNPNTQDSTVEQPGNSSNSSSPEPTDTTEQSTDNSGIRFDEQGIATSTGQLSTLLLTQFEFANNKLTPTTTWICSDGVSQTRFYYFYAIGVLDGRNPVVIERTLNVNDTYTDISFFWQTLGNDALMLVSAEKDSNGVLQGTDRQYDISTIRFDIVDDRTTFTADSVLRGSLICAVYDID